MGNPPSRQVAALQAQNVKKLKRRKTVNQRKKKKKTKRLPRASGRSPVVQAAGPQAPRRKRKSEESPGAGTRKNAHAVAPSQEGENAVPLASDVAVAQRNASVAIPAPERRIVVAVAIERRIAVAQRRGTRTRKDARRANGAAHQALTVVRKRKRRTRRKKRRKTIKIRRTKTRKVKKTRK